MSTVLPPGFESSNLGEPALPVRLFTVPEYLRMSETGILTEDDPVELLEGLILHKMTKNPRHDAAIDLLMEMLWRLLPAGWYPRDQKVLLTDDSAPEPDVTVARGKPLDYWNKHPTAADVTLVMEVAESSLDRDRRKRRIYARAGVATYWIVNLDGNCIEVFTEPNPAASEYKRRQVVPLAAPLAFALGDAGSITLPLDTALTFS